MDFNLINVVIYLLLGGIKLVRYVTLHVAIPHVVDNIIFEKIINWVGDHVIGEVPVVLDDNTTGDANGV